MQLKKVRDIEDNVYSTTITIDSFGTEQLSEDDEKESLKDYPEKIAYRNLTFSKNVKIENGAPVVTDEAVDDEAETVTVREVTLPPISNREITLDPNFTAAYRVDAKKVVASALDENVLTTKDLVARAYIAVFESVIVEAVEEAMEAIRANTPPFAEEILVTV